PGDEDQEPDQRRADEDPAEQATPARTAGRGGAVGPGDGSTGPDSRARGGGHSRPRSRSLALRNPSATSRVPVITLSHASSMIVCASGPRSGDGIGVAYFI